MSTSVVPNGSKQQITVKEKVDPMYNLRQAVNHLFDDLGFGRSFPRMSSEFAATFNPRVDVKEDEKEVTVTAELPGIKKEDIDVQVYGDSLILSGEKKEEKEEKKTNYHRVERSYGSFQRVLPLPVGIDREAISAVTEHGVLTIKLPKTKAAQEAAKKIEIKSK